jgi:hypothetical protein
MLRRVLLGFLVIAVSVSLAAAAESVEKFMKRMEESYVAGCMCSCLEQRIELSLTYEGVIYGAAEGSCDLARYAAEKWRRDCGASFDKPTCALGSNSIQNDICARCTTALASAVIASGKRQLTATREDYLALLAAHEAGQPVAVTIQAADSPPPWYPPELGFTGGLPPTLASGDAFMGFFSTTAHGGGVLIMATIPGAACALAGMKAGDVMLTIAGQPLRRNGDQTPILTTRRPGEYVVLLISRDDELLFTVLQLQQTI